jgi:hypothetical protein
MPWHNRTVIVGYLTVLVVRNRPEIAASAGVRGTKFDRRY